MDSFDVYGVRVQLSTPMDEFTEFVSQNYSQFGTAAREPDIKVVYSEQAGRDAEQRTSNLRNAGGGLLFDSNVLYWENEYGFRVHLSYAKDGTVTVRSFHHDLLGKADEEERLKDFQRSMRWAIHFPVFTRLQYQRGWRLLHSSAVVKDGEALVFCGLNGVGKSTLAVYLARERGYELMTDNFLLVGDGTVFGFPEVVRLSPAAAERMDFDSVWDNPVYDKYHVDPETIGAELRATPAAFFLINRGNTLETQRVDSLRSWETMQNLHSYLGEFPEHSYLGLWPHVTGETMNTELSTRTMTTTPWYELSYKPNWNLEALADEVERCI